MAISCGISVTVSDSVGFDFQHTFVGSGLFKLGRNEVVAPRMESSLTASLSSYLNHLGQCLGSLELMRIREELLHGTNLTSHQPHNSVIKLHLEFTCTVLYGI